MSPYLDWEDFCALSLEPNVSFTDDANWLAVAVPAEWGAAPQGILDWCRRQPVPIIAIGHAATFADVVVGDEHGLHVVTQAIDTNPGASAVLVQVLRTTLELPIAQALVMESLAYATLQGGREFRAWLSQQPERRSKAGDAESMVLLSRDDACLSITLNSPANRNALSAPMRDALADAFRLVAMDDSIREVIVSAQGPAFCAGGDLSEFGTASDLAAAHATRMRRMPAPYLAPHAERYTFRLKGDCVGAGIELPAFAGRVIAAPDTRLRLPEVGMGLIPGAGGCVSIPRRIGRQRTAMMALTGRAIDAREALEWGLVDAIDA